MVGESWLARLVAPLGRSVLARRGRLQRVGGVRLARFVGARHRPDRIVESATRLARGRRFDSRSPAVAQQWASVPRPPGMTEFAAEWIFGDGPPQGIPFAGGLGLAGVEDATGPPSFLEQAEEPEHRSDAAEPPASSVKHSPIEEFTPAFRLSRKPTAPALSGPESSAEAVAPPAAGAEPMIDEPGPTRAEEAEAPPLPFGPGPREEEKPEPSTAARVGHGAGAPRVALSRSPERQSRPDRPVVAIRSLPAAALQPAPVAVPPVESRREASGGLVRRLARAVSRRPNERELPPAGTILSPPPQVDLVKPASERPTVGARQAMTAEARKAHQEATPPEAALPSELIALEPDVRQGRRRDLPRAELPDLAVLEPEGGEPAPAGAAVDVANDAPGSSAALLLPAIAQLERESEPELPDDSASSEAPASPSAPPAQPRTRPRVRRAAEGDGESGPRDVPPEQAGDPASTTSSGTGRTEIFRQAARAPANVTVRPSSGPEAASPPDRRSGPVRPLLRTVARQLRRERGAATVEYEAPTPLDAAPAKWRDATSRPSPSVLDASPPENPPAPQWASRTTGPAHDGAATTVPRSLARAGRPPVQLARVVREPARPRSDSQLRSTAGRHLAEVAGTTFARSSDGLETVDFVWPPWEESGAAPASVASLSRLAAESSPEPAASEAPAAAPSAAPTAAPALPSGAPAPAAHGGSDIEDIYEQVVQRLRRELLVERERMGDLLGDLP
jgi:hypothetical protein